MPHSPDEGNRYDKIFKENIEATILPVLSKLVQMPFTLIRRITEKQQSTLEREADFLALIRDEVGKEKILHLEFQVRGDQDMVYRMGEYHGIIQRKYKLPIIHIVLFLGERTFKGQTRLKDEEVFTSYIPVDFHSISHQSFLDSHIPEEVLLAILADFEERSPEAVFRLIFQRISQLVEDTPSLKKYITQLSMLSRLRNLATTFTQIQNDMPITYDPTHDPLFNMGIQKGIEKGIQKGIEKGTSSQIDKLIINAVKAKFTLNDIVTLTQMSQKEVESIIKRLKREGSL